MAGTAITPLTALPTTSGSISGQYVPTGINVRLSGVLTASGNDELRVIRQNGTGYWEYLKYPTGPNVGQPVLLKLGRTSSANSGASSVEFQVNQGDPLHVVTTTGAAESLTYESLNVPSGLASLPSHGSNHLSSGPDPIPLAVAGGASGLMSGTQAQELAELVGGTGPQTWTAGATATGTAVGFTLNNNGGTLGAGDLLLALQNNGTNEFTVGYNGALAAPSIGPSQTQQHTLPAVASDTVALVGAAQNFLLKTLTAPVLAGLTASGSTANDFSGSTGTFKTSTGAVTIGGGAAAITATSSAAAITLTAGAASVWSTTSGALALAGAAGVNLRYGATVLIDAGATTSTSVTLGANINLAGAAGTGALSLGSMTGATTLPTGSISWTGASTKSVSLVSTGAGSSITLTAGAASVWSTSTGALTLDSAAALNLGNTNATSIAVGKSGITTTITGGLTQLTGAVSLTGNGASSLTTSAGALTLTGAAASTWSTASGALTLTSAAAATWSTAAGALTLSGAGGINAQYGSTTLIDFGVTTSTAVTLGANTALVGAAGTGALTLGSMTGATTLPTGSLSWAGASTKSVSLVATGGAITITADAASVWKTTTGALTVDAAAALQLGTTAATSIAVGNGSITTTVTGSLALGTKWIGASSTGTVGTYNNETTAGVGQSYIRQVAQDIASVGSSTTIATLASPASGLYRVSIVVSAHTNSDTVVAQVTYTDAIEAFATTLVVIPSTALTHDANAGTISGSVLIRASGASSIVAILSTTAQTTTKASAVIERLN